MFKDGKGFMICSYSLISFLHYLHKPTLNGVLCHKNSNPCGRPEGDGFGIRRGRCCRCCALRCKGEMRIGATETKRREAFMGNWKYRNTTKVMILFHLSVSMNQGIFFGEMEWKWCVFAADDLLFSYCWRCYLCFKITQGTTPLLPDASVPLGSSCNSVGITAGKSSCSVVLRISFGKQGYQVSLLVAKSWSDFMPIFSRCFNSKLINMESKLQTCRLQLIPRIRLPTNSQGKCPMTIKWWHHKPSSRSIWGFKLWKCKFGGACRFSSICTLLQVCDQNSCSIYSGYKWSMCWPSWPSDDSKTCINLNLGGKAKWRIVSPTTTSFQR